MSRPESQAADSVRAGHSVGDTVAAFPAGRKPTGTLSRSASVIDTPRKDLHSVGLFRQCLDDHIFIVFPPPLHQRIRRRMHHRFDIISNILILSAFVVE